MAGTGKNWAKVCNIAEYFAGETCSGIHDGRVGNLGTGGREHGSGNGKAKFQFPNPNLLNPYPTAQRPPKQNRIKIVYWPFLTQKYVNQFYYSNQFNLHVYGLPAMHDPRLTTYDSRHTTHYARFTTQDSRLTTQDSRLTTHDPLLTIHYARLSRHDSLPTTHDQRLTTHD